MSDRTEVADFLRRIVPYLKHLPGYLDEMDEKEQRLGVVAEAINSGNAELKELNAEISRLNGEIGRKQQTVDAMVIEAEGRAREIVTSAEARAAKLIEDAESKAAQVREAGDAYYQERVARFNRMHAELAA